MCDETDAKLSISKFADIIALTLLANTGNKMVGSEDYIKRLVALAK